jgi:hypothetical protein
MCGVGSNKGPFKLDGTLHGACGELGLPNNLISYTISWMYQIIGYTGWKVMVEWTNAISRGKKKSRMDTQQMVKTYGWPMRSIYIYECIYPISDTRAVSKKNYVQWCQPYNKMNLVCEIKNPFPSNNIATNSLTSIDYFIAFSVSNIHDNLGNHICHSSTRFLLHKAFPAFKSFDLTR